MLKTLSIRNVVLIDSLDIDFSGGLTVLSGETGAGKSILLDSLGLLNMIWRWMAILSLSGRFPLTGAAKYSLMTR